MANGNDRDDAMYAALCGQYRVPTKIRVTSTVNTLSALLSGRYYTLRPTVDVFYALNATDVTSTNGTFIAAGDTDWLPMRGEANAAFITDGGSGYVDLTEKKA